MTEYCSVCGSEGLVQRVKRNGVGTADSVAGVVLAAGAGRGLVPLTRERPKALCPVGDVALVDHAITRLSNAVSRRPEAMAVNIHHGRDQMEVHLSEALVHRSVEAPQALGTAGALGQLREWIDGRAVLATNADAWLPADLDMADFVGRWDGERARVLVVEDPTRGDFGPVRYCGVTLLPWAMVARLKAEPTGLYEVCWRQAWLAGVLDVVTHRGPFVDCGTPADYLAANLLSSGGASVIGWGAHVGAGARVVRSVLWPGSRATDGEVLVDAVRTTGGLTILVR